MKQKGSIKNILPVFFAALGLCAAVAGIWLSLSSIGAKPVLLERSEAAREQVIRLLDRVCEGDFDGAGALMQGAPSLGADREVQDEAGVMLWQVWKRCAWAVRTFICATAALWT